MTGDYPKETLVFKNPFTEFWRLVGRPTGLIAAAMLVIFLVMMFLFLTYTGWVLGARPMSELAHYELENTPPPEYARSFSINHGSAVYYRDDVPSKHPVKRNVILAAFFGLYAVLLALIIVLWRQKKRARLAQDPPN